jgi:hypothetical protein
MAADQHDLVRQLSAGQLEHRVPMTVSDLCVTSLPRCCGRVECAREHQLNT